MAVWYCGSTKHAAIAQWASSTAYSEGDIVRQLAAPAIGSERAFRCTTAGTSGGSEPTWSLTAGSTTNDGTAVWTEVTGNSTYGWSAAIARMSGLSATWCAAGDTVYVSNNHTEAGSGANYGISATAGTSNAPISFICVNDAAAPPTAVATGATISSPNAYALNINGYLYFYGITFNAGTNGASTGDININSSAAASFYVLENCTLALNNTNIASRINFGITSAALEQQGIELKNCQLKFGNASQSALLRLPVKWQGGSVLGATYPNTLFGNPGANGAPFGSLIARGIDLSGMGSKTLVAATSGPSDFLFTNCKLGTDAVIYSGTLTRGGATIRLVHCNAGDVNYSWESHSAQGSVYADAAVYRTGGASDGTTSFSVRMASSAGTLLRQPLVFDRAAFWNETVGSLTVTVEVVTDGVTLTDAEAWIEVEYLGVNGFPQTLFASDRAADEFATPANQTTSSETWTTTGLTSPLKQALACTVSVAEKGWVRVSVCVAKPSTTVYVCPKVVVS